MTERKKRAPGAVEAAVQEQAEAARVEEPVVPVRYVGPNGAWNVDVAEATGGGVAMEHGKTYRVPAKLAGRLVRTADWEGAE